MLSAVLIVYKIAVINRNLEDSGALRASAMLRKGNLTSRVIFIIVESAAIYSINNLLYCILYAVQQVPETWFSGMVCGAELYTTMGYSGCERNPLSRASRLA